MRQPSARAKAAYIGPERRERPDRPVSGARRLPFRGPPSLPWRREGLRNRDHDGVPDMARAAVSDGLLRNQASQR